MCFQEPWQYWVWKPILLWVSVLNIFALVVTKLGMVSPVWVLKFYHCKQIDLTFINIQNSLAQNESESMYFDSDFCVLWCFDDKGPQFSVAIFSKFCGPVCQIPRLAAANFPNVPINFLRPQKPTKYAAFVVGKLSQLPDTVCLPNKQEIFQISSIFSIFLTLELERQWCI